VLATEHSFDYLHGMTQRRFEDLGTPLSDVTFVVIDLETTGGSPANDRITEVGAVKVRGGECLGTLQTFINPGCAIPPSITVLTGITEAMVIPAPPIEQVLPTLLEFIGDAVVVGHNVRFDTGFVDAALKRTGRPPLHQRRVDTCNLARRLVRDEVPNCKLGTLAHRFGLAHQPSHRALDDALATADLLHVLLERAAGLGVTGLDDLLALPTMAGHAQAAKLALTSQLPRTPGVYLFGNGRGEVLYVGKATNLRARVRSYFSGDDRRKVGALLRQTQHIDHLGCVHPLEAEVREVRLIQTLTPRYNRHATDPSRYRYVRLSHGADQRVTVTRVVQPDAGVHLGPMSSTSAARRVVEAITTVVPSLAAPSRRHGPNPLLGADGNTTPWADQVCADPAMVADAFAGSPAALLAQLQVVMSVLAATEDFEQAAVVRDRSATLAHALGNHRRLGWLHRSGSMAVEVPGHGGAEFSNGLLVSTWGADGQVRVVDTPLAPLATQAVDDDPSVRDTPRPGVGPVPRWLTDELRVVAAWLDRHAATARVLHGHSGPTSAWPRPPSFKAAAPATGDAAVAA
jgi:DNA polymerase III subunit epsilon